MKLMIIDEVNGIGFVTSVVGKSEKKPVKMHASKLMLSIWSPESKMLAKLCNISIVMGLLR